MNNIILFIFSLIFLVPSLRAETFSFSKSYEEWGVWGTGLSSHDTNVGRGQKGSIWLSADWGEVETIHYSWSKLRPGIYKITAYVRAQGVQSHTDGTSFWHFYDGGSGTENAFSDLNGSYEWRKVEYTLKVSKSALTLWFRLKSPGQVWIDDVTIEPVAVAMPSVKISEPTPLKNLQKSKAPNKGASKEITLLDFDKVTKPHPFDAITNSDGKKMGKAFSRRYYNFSPSSYLNANWSLYDRIQLDVFNGEKHFVEFFLTLGDAQSNNYWSQLNHKTHLAPGWNHLNFSLNQFIGERGSHRFNRALNLASIKKWFLIIDGNEKHNSSSNFFVDNIKLSYDPAPEPPGGVLAFDFTSHKDSISSGYKKVTTQDAFNNENGYGFDSPKFWRVEDAQWVGNPLQYSIGILGGHFRVKLPNGSYKMSLVIERLGFWDVSFWKDRTVYLNGKPVFKESRPYGKDYLKDWLQFEKNVPSIKDHPYDLYLKKIFNPLEFSFSVTNGFVDLEFEGDATGINLNSLIIWKIEDEQRARDFISASEKRLKLEFDWMARPVGPQADPKTLPSSLVSVISSSLTLRPDDVAPSKTQSLSFQGGFGEKPYQVVQVRGDGMLSWQVSDLVSKEGNKISSEEITFSEIIPQYISPDLNHETYMVAGKFFKEIKQNKIPLNSHDTKYLWLQIRIKAGIVPSIYKGNISFQTNSGKTILPVEIRCLAYELPQIDFPVGFFGPEPIAHTYYSGHGLDKLRKEARQKALMFLGEAGFTTFSGLPAAKLEVTGSDWTLDTSAPDEAMTAANRAGMLKTYFSYAGKFPQQFFDGSMIPSGLTEEQFFQKVAPLLKNYLSRPGMPKVVHTFSDEAGGYSDKVNEDLVLAKKMKNDFPFLLRGGFGSKGNSATSELNSYFDYAFFSNVSNDQARGMGHKNKWGSYNASPGNLDDPRFTFGPGLYYARGLGLSHYLEWHASAVNNFPYYDLDGRESDVTMFMPASNGALYSTIRFELATEGLHSFRKLMLLEERLRTGYRNPQAARWLDSIKRGTFSSPENILKPTSEFDFEVFKAQLNKFLGE